MLPGDSWPKFKIFVDMDGVLTDFNRAVTAIGGEAGLGPNVTPIQQLDMYKKIDNAGVKFWSEMPWKEDGPRLWKLIEPYRPILLSSPGQFIHAVEGKTQWVSRNLPGTPLFFSEHKYEYAEPYEDTVLIDDMQKNIIPWQQAGGIGILHTSVEDTERQLLGLIYDTASEKAHGFSRGSSHRS